MDFGNTVNIDGKVIASENIKSLSRTVPITPGATSLANTIIDWSKSNTHILDMTNLDLSGGGSTADLILVRGNESNVRQRLVIVQNNVAPPNHIELTLLAYETEALTTPYIVEDAVELQALINVAGRVTVIEFDFYNGVYRTLSTSYKETNTYTSNNVISDGDTYNISLSKIDEILGKLKPADAPWLDDAETALSFDASTPAKLGWKVLGNGLPADNLTFVDPILHISTFKFEEAGSTSATINTVNKGSILNNSFAVSLPDTKTDVAMSLTKKTFNAFSEALDLTLQLQGANAIAPSGLYQSIEIASAARNNTFQLLRCVQPSMSTAPTYVDLGCNVIPSTNYICGIPVLRASDALNAIVKFNDVAYINTGDGVYGSTVGKLTSSLINAVNVASPSNTAMLASAPNSPDMTVNAPVLNNVFSTNASITAINYIAEIGTNGASTVLTRPTNPIFVDSITNQALFGIDHTQPLTNAANINKPLVLGGIVQYPKLDYSNVWNGSSAQGGLDYSVISNDRFIEFNVTMNQYSRLKVEFNNQTGFTNAAIEAGAGFEISLKRADKPTESYNGNLAYDGVGVVGNGEGALDVADSSKSIKMLTFGEVVSTVATVRITLKNTSNHKFGQNITITPML